MPERLGPYLIEDQIGAGGMGNVYRGKHAGTGQVVAIKVLPGELARQPGFVARFEREIEVMRALRHPHIVRLYEHGNDQGVLYYAMEYIDGESLTDRLKRERRIPWREAVQMMIPVCGALKSAHDAGIIHRDLKPSNLLIDSGGTVKLTDFGVAHVFASDKLTVTGGIIGTAEYMSPEQAFGGRVTQRSDLYSLGAVLYAMLTGRPPYTGASPVEILQKHRFGQFDRPRAYVPEIPGWLDDLVAQLLSKEPQQRPPDAYVLSRRLQEIVRKVELQVGGDVSTVESAYAGSGRNGSTPLDAADAAALAGRAVHAASLGNLADLPPDLEVGPTFVRNLIRAEIKRMNQQGPVARFFNNTYVLILCFIATAGTGAYLFLNQRVDPEEQFLAAKELLRGHPSRQWITARDKYLLPLLLEDPVYWRPILEPYLRQVDVYELETSLTTARRGDTLPPPASEPERLLRLARAQLDSGDVPAARRTFEGLRELVAGNERYIVMRIVIDHQLENLARQQVSASERDSFLLTAFERADILATTDDGVPEARRVWNRVIELYDEDPTARDWTSLARQRLAEVKARESAKARAEQFGTFDEARPTDALLPENAPFQRAGSVSDGHTSAAPPTK